MTAIPSPFSAEFALLLACCRWPRTAASDERTRQRTAVVDWAQVAGLARRHRVEGLVRSALLRAGVEPPQPANAELSVAANRIAQQNLEIAAESIRLNRHFVQAGLSPLFVKGVTLGKLVYGDIGLKAGWDIDLLVSPEDLAPAAAALEVKGYKLVTPATCRAPDRLALWHRHCKESVWRSADGKTFVELHTALADNPMLLPGMGPASPRFSVEVSPGLFLPTLARDELFAYLCVHGASSAWFRLKWIADLAGLIGDEPADEIDRLHRRAVELGAGRAAALALLLARSLFGTAVSAKLERELRSDRINRWLVAAALRKLTGRTGDVELGAVALGTASIHLSQLGLMRGWRFKRAELVRQLVSPIDRVATPLPRALAWLYPLFQAARLVRGRAPD